MPPGNGVQLPLHMDGKTEARRDRLNSISEKGAGLHPRCFEAQLSPLPTAPNRLSHIAHLTKETSFLKGSPCWHFYMVFLTWKVYDELNFHLKCHKGLTIRSLHGINKSCWLNQVNWMQICAFFVPFPIIWIDFAWPGGSRKIIFSCPYGHLTTNNFSWRQQPKRANVYIPPILFLVPLLGTHSPDLFPLSIGWQRCAVGIYNTLCCPCSWCQMLWGWVKGGRAGDPPELQIHWVPHLGSWNNSPLAYTLSYRDKRTGVT